MSSLTLSNVKSSKINLLFLNLNLYSFTFPFSDFNVLFNSGIKSKSLPQCHQDKKQTLISDVYFYIYVLKNYHLI